MKSTARLRLEYPVADRQVSLGRAAVRLAELFSGAALSEVTVTPNQLVQQGQLIGRSGGQATEEGSHIQFQIRQTVGQGQPQAVNPLDWLVNR